MYGPWRIADECPATNHGSVYAARGYNTVQKCVCPSAAILIKRQNKEVARRQRDHRMGKPVVPSWWTGPWRINELCPATGHNVLTRVNRPLDGLRCICPHAQALYVEFLEKKRVRNKDYAKAKEAERGKYVRPHKTIKVRPVKVKDNHLHAMPDYGGAACKNMYAVKKFDRAFDAPYTKLGEVVKDHARLICNTKCAIRDQCRGWALQEEKPAGSWGGVWGGLDPRERQAFWAESQNASAS